MFEPSHRETQTRLPDPLAGTGFLNIGTWALPAVALSVASAVVFAIVVLFLQRDLEIRSFFILPRTASLPLAVFSAALSWIIVLQCRRRPGRPLPRLWALVLAILNSGIALLVLVVPKSSWANALLVGGLAAGVTLLPRLTKLRPDSGLVPLVAPLAFIGVLLLVLPSVWMTGRMITERNRSRVDEVIRQLRLWNTVVREVSAHDWSRLEEDVEAASLAVDPIARVQPAGLLDDPDLWRQAAILGKEKDLSQVAQGLTDSVVAGLSPERVPKVSSLQEPAIFWDVNDHRWEAGLTFPKVSELVGRYHQELGRIFKEIDSEHVAMESHGWVDLKEYCGAKKKDLRASLETQMKSWADNWAVFRVPGHRELLSRSEVPLLDLLQTSVTSNGSPAWAPANLPLLLKLPLGTVRERSAGFPGCRALDYVEPDKSGDEYQYFRLDCYSYSPQPEGLGATLRVEMRLVYKSSARSSLSGSQLPAEVFFLFPIPASEKSESFGSKLMNDLSNAVRDVSGAKIQYANRSTSTTTGFRVVQNGTTIRVVDPKQRTLFEDLKAWEVRAVY